MYSSESSNLFVWKFRLVYYSVNTLAIILCGFLSPQMETLPAWPLWVTVDLGIMAMKDYSLLSRNVELESYPQIKFSVIPSTPTASLFCVRRTWHILGLTNMVGNKWLAMITLWNWKLANIYQGHLINKVKYFLTIRQ